MNNLLLTIKILILKIKAYHFSLCMVLIDFEKANDSVEDYPIRNSLQTSRIYYI